MMRSMHVTDALSAYVDGALSESERTHVERHLETCADCRRHLSTMRDLVAVVQSVAPVAAPEGFRAQVQSRVEQIAARPPARWWPSHPMRWRLLGAAAAALVIGVFAVNLLRTEGPVAVREMRAPAPSDRQAVTRDQMRSGAERGNMEAEPAPKTAQRTIPTRSPALASRVLLATLPIVVLGGLAWMALRRRRVRRV